MPFDDIVMSKIRSFDLETMLEADLFDLTDQFLNVIPKNIYHFFYDQVKAIMLYQKKLVEHKQKYIFEHEFDIAGFDNDKILEKIPFSFSLS